MVATRRASVPDWRSAVFRRARKPPDVAKRIGVASEWRQHAGNSQRFDLTEHACDIRRCVCNSGLVREVVNELSVLDQRLRVRTPHHHVCANVVLALKAPDAVLEMLRYTVELMTRAKIEGGNGRQVRGEIRDRVAARVTDCNIGARPERYLVGIAAGFGRHPANRLDPPGQALDICAGLQYDAVCKL